MRLIFKMIENLKKYFCTVQSAYTNSILKLQGFDDFPFFCKVTARTYDSVNKLQV